MRTTLLCLAAVAVCAWGMAEDEAKLEGRMIKMDAGAWMSISVPLALPYDGPVPEGKIEVLENKTGRLFPVTVHDGELVFVSDGAMPNTSHEYKVQVTKENLPPRVRIEPVAGKDELEVYVFDRHFTTFHYSKDFKKPFLWPVNAGEDIPITRAYPVGDKELTEDHPHHKSLWSSYGNINGVDCWGEGDNSGLQVVQDVQHASGDAFGWITAKSIWQSKEGQPVLVENREYRFYATPVNGRLMDVKVTFTASYGDVLFGDTKEGGIVSVRMRDTMTEKNGGTITNAEGLKGMAECWGKPSPWCDYSAPVDEKGVYGLTIFDHPSNLRYPTSWHVRDYGLMGANCFGYSHFTKGEKNGDFTLKNNESLTFRYRVFVHAGDATKAMVAERFSDFTNTPKLSWIDPK